MALIGENFKIIVNYKMTKMWGGSKKNGVIPPEKQTKLVFGIIEYFPIIQQIIILQYGTKRGLKFADLSVNLNQRSLDIIPKHKLQ